MSFLSFVSFARRRHGSLDVPRPRRPAAVLSARPSRRQRDSAHQTHQRARQPVLVCSFCCSAFSLTRPRDGDDGPWSTFRIEVGTPPQQIHVLPAADQSASWLVIPEACLSTQDQNTCLSDRGGVYSRNESSSWAEYGSYSLSSVLEQRLGQGGAGLYGYDTIQLGWNGDNLPSAAHQILSGYVSTDFYIGSLALNPRPMNFTNYNDPIPSFLTSLKSSSSVPSLSWSYTAGAYNLSPKVFGSLVLGGYDSTRFQANSVTFPFGSDISLDFQVAIQSVSTNMSSQPLLSNPIISYIDTLAAEIWLPQSVCDVFEQTFGLTWDNATQLYLMDDRTHKNLLSKNPQITFQVGPHTSGSSVSINMPYWNFYQTAKPARTNGSSSLYFPLKRAANDSQYILGRTFLQSAHLSADYERSQFNLSQALYPDSSINANVVAVQPPARGPSAAPSSNSKAVSPGLIAGAAVGGIAALAMVGVVFYVLRRRRRQAVLPHINELGDTDVKHTMKHEMMGESLKYELQSGYELRHEVAGDNGCTKAELWVDEKPAEADAANVAIYEMAAEDIVFPELEGEGTLKPVHPEGPLDDKHAPRKPASDGWPPEKSDGKREDG